MPHKQENNGTMLVVKEATGQYRVRIIGDDGECFQSNESFTTLEAAEAFFAKFCDENNARVGPRETVQ